MPRNKIIAIVALVTIGLASPTGAFARGGGGGRGGGGFHGGGGSFHGGGFDFREGGFRGGGFGFFGPYAYDDYPYYGSDYEGGCYLIARRIPTRDGWRTRRVEVCD